MGSFVEMANTELEYICMLHQLSSHHMSSVTRSASNKC